MSRSTISTFKIFEMFPDAETARLYLTVMAARLLGTNFYWYVLYMATDA